MIRRIRLGIGIARLAHAGSVHECLEGGMRKVLLSVMAIVLLAPLGIVQTQGQKTMDVTSNFPREPMVALP
jgi:hypothetical protein